jgi:hypothetical protein
MGTAWKMPIAVIGKPTGDGRQFDAGALGHRDLPLPLRYVASDSGGHSNAVIVGHISKIGNEKSGVLPAEGEFYDDSSWPEDVRSAALAARKFTANKVIGPSVDLDQQEVEIVPEPKAYSAWKKEQAGKIKAAKMAHSKLSGSDCGCGADPVMAEEPYDGPRLRMIRSGRLASATLVHIPAFAELAGHAKLTLDSSDPNVDGTTASAKIENDAEMSDDQDTGIWLTDDDFLEFAKRRLPSKNKDGETEPSGQAEHGGLFADRSKIDDADFVDPEGRRFPITDCSSVGDAVSSYGRANPKIPYEKFKARVMAIAKRKGCESSLPDNWKAGAKMAALMAAGAPAAPLGEWFDDPDLPGPTPLHIGDDGRVYGHVAVWDTCHVGIGNSCVKPPKTQTNYAYFHTGEVVVDDGSRIPVGRLTYGGGHAQPSLGYRAAAEHYDQTSNTGALVRAGEDAHGIWVAGALTPEADEAAVRQMRAAPLSGDWRRIGGNLEMVAALHVNTAGFPIPRAMAASIHGGVLDAAETESDMLSLVSAGALPRVIDEGEQGTVTAAGPLDTEELGRAIARGMIAEQQAAADRTARASEWNELVAAAMSEGREADYDEAMGDLLVALVEE